MNNNYTFQDFIEDQSFQSFIKGENETDVKFWEYWICEHPEKATEFNSAKIILNNLNSAYKTVTPSAEKELERLQSKIQIEKDDRETTKQYRIFQFVKYAAVFIILIGLGLFLKLIVFPDKNNSDSLYAYKEIKTPKGKRMHIVLSDGTHIWLNSESILKYPEEFAGNERKVYLEGEAYFNVTSNKLKPFYVYAGEVRVKVLGTLFNVRSYPDDNFVETTLEKGKINIELLGSNHSGKDVITLDPNQKVKLYKSGYIPETEEKILAKSERFEKIESKNAIISHNVETGLYTSWKDEKLTFKSERLSNLKSRLERWYNVPIVIRDTQLYEKKFTGTFVKEPLQEALKALSAASEMKFEIKNDTLILMLKTDTK